MGHASSLTAWALFATAWLSASAWAESGSPWGDLTRRDVAAAYELIRENHPGPVDRENAGFGEHLERARKEALETAGRVKSFDGYRFCLERFAARFRDGHLNFMPTVERPRLTWPGFIVSRRGKDFLVHSSEGQDVPQPGVQIVSCDGRELEDILREDVLPYQPMEPDLESTRARLAPWTLVDEGNPFLRRVERCLIRENGQDRQIALSWREAKRHAVQESIRAAQFGKPPELGLVKLGSGAYWVSLPSFDLGGGKAEAMGRLIEQVRNLRNVALLVFDVRGNSGGSSEWGERFFEAALGRRPPADTSHVDWRVSAGNLEHLRSVLPVLRQQFGPDASVIREIGRIEAGMAKALERGESLYPERSPPADAARSVPEGAGPQQIVLLTDGRCGSACLDFADILLAEKIVVHAGLATAADTNYMELRRVDLPSGLGKLAFPIKVYRGRKRKANQPHVPAQIYAGDIGDTDAVRNWLLAIIPHSVR